MKYRKICCWWSDNKGTKERKKERGIRESFLLASYLYLFVIPDGLFVRRVRLGWRVCRYLASIVSGVGFWDFIFLHTIFSLLFLRYCMHSMVWKHGMVRIELSYLAWSCFYFTLSFFSLLPILSSFTLPWGFQIVGWSYTQTHAQTKWNGMVWKRQTWVFHVL